MKRSNTAGLGYKASTIIPYFVLNYCASTPGVCAAIVTQDANNVSVQESYNSKSVLINN